MILIFQVRVSENLIKQQFHIDLFPNMDLPKKFLDEITQTHLKYLKKQCVADNIKYTLNELNLEEKDTIYEYLKEEYGDKIEYETFKRELQIIAKNVEDLYKNDSKLLVYDFLNKSQNMESQNYLFHLLEIYFQQMHQEIPTLTKQVFENLVRIVFSYITFEKVIKQLRKGTKPSKESLRQLLECILYKRMSRIDCSQIVFNKIETFKYEFVKFDLKSFDGGAGMLGEHLKLEITIKHENKTKLLNLFMKFAAKGTGAWDTLSARSCNKEIFIYSEMIPKLKKFGASDLVNFAPKCYLLREHELIVLENLTPLGYTFTYLSDSVKYDWMVSAIKQLSKFHACSFILELNMCKETSKEMSLGDIYTDYLNELIFVKNGLLGFSSGEDLVSEYYIEEAAELWTEMSIDQFKKKFLMTKIKVFEDIKRSKKYYNVICHGDIHGRNVLTNEHQKCVLIDFQLIRYCPPALDLLFLIYISTSKDLRKNHMAEFIEIYYDFLKQYLNSHNVDITQYYTWDRFSESIECYKLSSIIIALLYLQINLYSQELIKEYDNSREKIEKYYHEERTKPFSEKIKNLIIELYDIYKNCDSL